MGTISINNKLYVFKSSIVKFYNKLYTENNSLS